MSTYEIKRLYGHIDAVIKATMTCSVMSPHEGHISQAPAK